MILTRLMRSMGVGEGSGHYLRHAFGELMLLVVGILIALQIDNWNDDREQRQTLSRYLNTIASNVSRDMEKLQIIRAQRQFALETVTQWGFLVQELPEFTVSEVEFGNRALARSLDLLHFEAKTSGYEALQRSRAFELVQGRDIEWLLQDYYDTVAQIAYREQNYNDYQKLVGSQLLQQWPTDLQQFHLDDPGTLSEDRFKALQPSVAQLFSGRAVGALFSRGGATSELLLNYHRLDQLGTALVRVIGNDELSLDPILRDRVANIFDPDRGIGHAELITAGQVSWLAYNLFVADSFQTDLRGSTAEQMDPRWRRRVFRLGSVSRTGESLRIAYPGGADWAGIWIGVRGLAENGARPSLDFSAFNKLQLEIKGETDGQTILLNVEDATDLQDGSSTRYPLEISDRWQTYEVNLSDFKTADFSAIWTPLGFVFLDEPQSFSVRNVRYLKQ